MRRRAFHARRRFPHKGARPSRFLPRNMTNMRETEKREEGGVRAIFKSRGMRAFHFLSSRTLPYQLFANLVGNAPISRFLCKHGYNGSRRSVVNSDNVRFCFCNFDKGKEERCDAESETYTLGCVSRIRKTEINFAKENVKLKHVSEV